MIPPDVEEGPHLPPWERAGPLKGELHCRQVQKGGFASWDPGYDYHPKGTLTAFLLLPSVASGPWH